MTVVNDNLSAVESVGDPFSDIYAIERIYPFQCSSISIEGQTSNIIRQNKNNNALLAVLTNQSDHIVTPDDDSWERVEYFRAIESKIDLTLNWLGKILVENSALPALKKIQLSRNGVKFSTVDDYCVGDYILVEMFVDTNYPQPISLIAKIYQISKLNEENEIIATFIHVAEEVYEKVERFIFKEQRHDLARRKNTAN